MPNLKLGPVTHDVVVLAVRGDQEEFRAEMEGFAHVGLGNASFLEDAIMENMRASWLRLVMPSWNLQKEKAFRYDISIVIGRV